MSRLDDEDFVPSFFDLDKYRLDEELENQPKLYWQHAETLAKARKRQAEMEAAKKVTWAEQASQIRSNPTDFGLEKATVDAVKEAVELQKPYRKAVQEEIDAAYEADIAKGAVDTLEHRKRALEKLCDLQLSNYYSKPRPGTSKVNQDAMKEQKRRSIYTPRKRGEE